MDHHHPTSHDQGACHSAQLCLLLININIRERYNLNININIYRATVFLRKFFLTVRLKQDWQKGNWNMECGSEDEQQQEKNVGRVTEVCIRIWKKVSHSHPSEQFRHHVKETRKERNGRGGNAVPTVNASLLHCEHLFPLNMCRALPTEALYYARTHTHSRAPAHVHAQDTWPLQLLTAGVSPGQTGHCPGQIRKDF